MNRKPTRREWLAGAAVAPLAACGAKPPREASFVSITRAPEYDQRLYGTVRSILEDHRLQVRGRNVLLKPNLVEFEAGNAINTHPLLVHAAYEGFRALGAASVRIAEGPGHRRNTLDLAESAGYFSTVPRFEEVFVDLNVDDVARARLRRQASGMRRWYLPRTALGADLLVSMPKMKTHHWTGATLAMKNLFGVVPGGVYGWPKNPLHWAGIEKCIVDLGAFFPRQFAIVDGIVGMEGNGPIQGGARRAGVLVAGNDPAAVDATCCRIMGIDPSKIGYLALASDMERNIGENRIRQMRESVATVASPFRLNAGFEHIRLEKI